MKTKEEIAILLSDKKAKAKFKNANFGQLVSALQSYDAEQKAELIAMLVSGRTKRIGVLLKDALLKQSKVDAKAEVDMMLADNLLSLDEIDELI